MAGITQKSFETLFPLWFLKKTVVKYIDLEQKETYKSSKIEVDIVSDIYWYFNNPTTSNGKKYNDNTPASTVTATVNH